MAKQWPQNFQNCQGVTDLRPGGIYRGSRGSLGYPGFWRIIKAEAMKREMFKIFTYRATPVLDS